MATKNNMKKLLSLVAISLFITSCGGNSKPGSDIKPTPEPELDYIFKEEDYNREINRDTVLFRSNYTVSISMNGSNFMTSYIDYGKFMTITDNYTGWYELVELGNNVIYTSYSPYGGWHKDTSTRTKEEIYSFFFMKNAFMFDLPYSSISLDEANKRYNIVDTMVGDKHVKSGYLVAKNKKPLDIEMEIEGEGVFHASFTNHGSTSVTFPETQDDRLEHITFTFDAIKSAGYSGNVEEEFNNKVTRYGFDYLVTYEYKKITGDRYQVDLYNVMPSDASLFIQYMKNNGDLRLYNAHDHGYGITDILYSSAPLDSYPIMYFPFNLERADCKNMYEETSNDKSSQNTDYCEINGEGEDVDYMYYFYLWQNFDSETCKFENINSSSIADYLILRINFDLVNESNISLINNVPHLGIPFYHDFNGNGIYDVADQQQDVALAHYITAIAKMDVTNCVFDLVQSI